MVTIISDELLKDLNEGKVINIEVGPLGLSLASEKWAKKHDPDNKKRCIHDNVSCPFCESFEVQIEGNHIRKDEDGQLDIMGDTGDAFWGVIENVKYCPYCGRRL